MRLVNKVIVQNWVQYINMVGDMVIRQKAKNGNKLKPRNALISGVLLESLLGPWLFMIKSSGLQGGPNVMFPNLLKLDRIREEDVKGFRCKWTK